MNALFAFIIFFSALFLLAYLTKRRFGVLGLALCAGSLLSTSWTNTLTPWVQDHGFSIVAPPLSAVVSTALVLGPAVVLLLSGPTYSSKIQRILGSLAFALLAFVLLLSPLSSSFVFDPTGYQIYTKLSHYGNLIIIFGVVAALADIFVTRTPHSPRRSKKSER